MRLFFFIIALCALSVTAQERGAATTTAAATATFPQVPSSVFEPSGWNNSTVLLTNGSSVLEATHLSEATIGSIGTKLALYYTSYDNTEIRGRIFAAYGNLTDGFVKHGAVLQPTPGQWDSGFIGGATHYRERGTNYLFYFGGTGFGVFEPEPSHIGVAWSTDGTNYTKKAGPILQTTDLSGVSTLYTFFPKKVGNRYLGFFNAKHSSGALERIHMAVADRITGPWRYVRQVYHHTNATVTSDFTVADLPDGGYLGLYWCITNGFFQSGTVYSVDLTNWIQTGFPGPFTSVVGTRLFWDDGLCASFCVSQTTALFSRVKRGSLGLVRGSQIVASTGFIGDGSSLSNLAAVSALNLNSEAGNVFSGNANEGFDEWWVSVAGPATNTVKWALGFRSSDERWFTPGGMNFGEFVRSTNGFASVVSNGVAPGVITLGASPYTWTNTNGVNTQVFIFGGTVSAVTVNGSSVSGTLSGTLSPIVQPGETVTVTYSAAPAMKFKLY